MSTLNGATVGARSAATNGSAATAGGGIDRVNAFDGLFLRAEHLTRMQDYALALVEGVGRAGGPGVVDGFGVSLHDDEVWVEPGLAIDPCGRPLRSCRTVKVPLPAGALADSEFLWVQISLALWTYGSEAVQGLLCDEPCAGGTTADGLQAEGVVVQLAVGSEPGLSNETGKAKRSWLSSRIFAEERRLSPPALDPGPPTAWPQPDLPVLGDRDWSPPAVDQSLPSYVRLAVVIPDPEGWQLDVWTARRDRGDPPPVRLWQTRIGMRPWDVFVAQVLQFQALLGRTVLSADAVQSKQVREEFLADLHQIYDVLGTGQPKKTSAALIENLSEKLTTGSFADEFEKIVARKSLHAVGIDELPPAGFLPTTGTKGDIVAEVTALLGGMQTVDVRRCRGPLSDLGEFLEQAQHRDRIPLGGAKQAIDIFVPTGPGGSQYDWVAFRRRELVACDGAVAATEPVDVYVLTIKEHEVEHRHWYDYLSDPTAAGAEDPLTLKLPDAGADYVLSYPVRTWALPNDADASAATTQVFDLLSEYRHVFAVALVSDASRRALGVVRAGLFAMHVAPDTSRGAEIRCIVRTDVAEAIVVVAPFEAVQPGEPVVPLEPQ